MKNTDYWKQRFTVLENASHSYGQKTYSQIESAFTQAQRDIQGEIDKWYGRFAKNNGVTLTDAKKLLSSKDLAELRWDVNQYIQYGRQNALNKQWMKELENASAKFHITRLEALQLRTQQAMEVAFGNQLDSVDKMARHIITENYYHSIFEVQHGFNIGWNIGQMNERVLDKLVVKPWAADGKIFSDRIWQQKQNMVGQLHRELVRNLILGRSPDEAIKCLKQFVDGEFKNARYAARRLVMTEQAYFHSVSQKETYEELDVEEFEILATIDSKTSKVCQEMDGKRFPMKDYEAGVTAPPFHPNCRSTTMPYDKDFGDIGERAARDKDGKTYYIPANMSYKDWKKKYVDAEGLTNGNGNSIMTTGSDDVALENQRYGRNKSTLVNKSYIEGGDYRRKFDKLSDNPELNKALYDAAKTALKHRSGTELEDMYWFDGKTGKILAKEVNNTVPRQVDYSISTKHTIRYANDKSLIALHTHPSSMPPSAKDFNACSNHGYKCGYIACHDGRVFGYSADERINETLYDLYIKQGINDGLSEFDAQIVALNKMKLRFKIDFWEVD